MASKDYDDLLESFMNNSSKAFDEDEKSLEEKNNKNEDTVLENKTERSYKAEEKLEKTRKAKIKKQINKNTEKSPSKKAWSKVGKAFLGILMVCCVVFVVCFSVVAIYGYSVVHGDKVFDLNEEKYSQNQTSFIYGTDDSGKTVEMTRLHGEENRIWVDKDDMSEYMADAFIAIEDKRFLKHHGVDWVRTIGVTVKMSGQGGSTITQQLIKNLTDENQVTIVRKFNEILQALNIEQNYSKDEIVEAYLNTVYLSNGCYGVKTAAEKYFGKDIANINIAECACIAAITQFPTKYDPLINPENNRERQLYILKMMYKEGYITKAQYDEAVDYKMIFTNSADYKGSQVTESTESTEKQEVNSYYVDFVITSVMEDLQKMGYTKKKAKDLVYGGGLKIYTSIDYSVQEAMEKVYENYEKMPDHKVQGAMVVMDYEGQVLGIVGGTGKKKVNLGLNRASMSERQPGSTIKPLSVYGPALEKSLQDDSTDVFWSTKVKDSPLMKVDGKWWPTNEGKTYSSNNVTIQYGLSRSMNTISARTLDMIGVDYSFDYITDKFHITSLDSVNDCDYAPMATGSLTNGVSVLEMTAAYASFGNGGYYYEPYCYTKIEDSQGNVIIEQKPEETREEALSTNTAWVMNKMLQTVMTEGTGTSYKLSGIQCYGKTGTTSENKDRWFIGGTPNYVAGVWYGYDTPKEVYYSLSPNPCGTIWKTVMSDIYSELGESEYDTEFPEVDGIVRRSYCTSCGKLRSGTGTYGWYDVNNLPGNCSGGHYEESNSGSSSGTTSSNSEKTTSSNGEETTASDQTTAPAETTSPATTAAAVQ